MVCKVKKKKSKLTDLTVLDYFKKLTHYFEILTHYFKILMMLSHYVETISHYFRIVFLFVFQKVLHYNDFCDLFFHHIKRNAFIGRHGA